MRFWSPAKHLRIWARGIGRFRLDQVSLCTPMDSNHACLRPCFFCSPRFLFRSELICCAHLDSSEGLFGWDVCWKCRLCRVHASRAPKTPLLMRIRSLIMSLFFLFRGLFLAEFIRDTHFDSGEGYSGRGWGCKCDLGKFSSAPCTEFAGCLRAHVFCSLNL